MVFNLECIKSKSNQIKIKEFPNKIKEFAQYSKIKEFPDKIKEFSLIGMSYEIKEK